MVALVLGAVILVGVLAVWRQTQMAYLDGAEAAEVQQTVRVAMEDIAAVVRAAGANPTNQRYAGAAPPAPANDPAFVVFREAGTSCLRLYSDLNGDGDVADPGENVSFNWAGVAGAPITRESGGGPDGGQAWAGPSGGVQELALNIVPNLGGVPIFQYFTGALGPPIDTPIPAGGPCGMPAAARAQIGRVVITLTVQGTVAGQTVRRTLVSEVRPRNVP
jgi:hypothetical protein